MTWLDAAPALTATLVLFFLPGMLFLLAMNFRGFFTLAFSPVISVTFVSLAALIAPLVKLNWGPLPVLLLTLILTALALPFRAKRFASKNTTQQQSRLNWHLAVALALASSAILIQLAILIGQPDNFAQEADNILHLNGTQFILDTQNASALHLTQLILPAGQTSFYPAAFHALTSLAVIISGASIPIAQTAVLVIISAVVWPLGIILLSKTLFPENTVVIYTSALLSAGFSAFPLMVLGQAGIFPFFLAVALIPAVFATVLKLLAELRHSEGFNTRLFLVILLAMPALLISHTSSAHFIAALCQPPVLAAIFASLRETNLRNKVLLIASAALAFVALALFWVKVIPGGLRNDYFGLITSVGQVALNSYNTISISVILTLGGILGIVLLIIRRKKIWLLATYLIIIGLYLATAAVPAHPLRNLLVAPWYADPARVFAILPIIAIPLAAYGLASGYQYLNTKIPANSKILQNAIVIGFVIILGASTQSMGITAQIAKDRAVFQDRENHNGWLQLSQDERDLIAQLPELVPADAVIAGSHYTGTSYAYALSGIQVMNPQYTWQALNDQNKNIVRLHLNEAMSNPEVCPAIRALNIEYILDFGPFPGESSDSQSSYYSGLDNLIENNVAELVTSVGNAKLLKLIQCN
ncbi:MAG: DUF6541 family protein [Microbacteriaceae bacterium]